MCWRFHGDSQIVELHQGRFEDQVLRTNTLSQLTFP